MCGESSNEPKKTCAGCKFALYDSGDWSVGIYGYWYCGITELKSFPEYRRHEFKGCKPIRKSVFRKLESVNWDEEKAPEICGQFTPRLIDKCGECSCEMNVPEYTWELWSYDIPVCSNECKNIQDMKQDRWLAECAKIDGEV